MKMKYTKDREEIESGCKYADDCFNCPFSDCIIATREASYTEDDYKLERAIILERAKYVKSLRDKGLKLAEIAEHMVCSVKTVKRDLIIAKREEEKANAEQDEHRKS